MITFERPTLDFSIDISQLFLGEILFDDRQHLPPARPVRPLSDGGEFVEKIDGIFRNLPPDNNKNMASINTKLINHKSIHD